MQINLLWTGQAYYSLENCILKTTQTGSEANAVIVGMSDGKIYRINYVVGANQNWQTIYCEINIQLTGNVTSFICQSDGKGNWTVNGNTAQDLDGCIDIDIALSPFSNTLPINRLKLRENEHQQIKVVYVDILANQLKPVLQKYTRLSDLEYRYENVPNDFEAVIRVDQQGLVVDYPGLFTRAAREESDWQEHWPTNFAG